MYSYLTLNEGALSFLNSKWLLWMFREKHETLDFTDNISINVTKLPFSEKELLNSYNKYINKCLNRCFSFFHNSGQKNILASRALYCLDYIKDLSKYYKINLINGKNLAAPLLPDIMRSLEKVFEIDVFNEKITIVCEKDELLGIIAMIHNKCNNLSVLGNESFIPAAYDVLTEFGLPLQLTNKALSGLVLYFSGDTSLINEKCRIINFTMQHIQNSYGISFKNIQVPAILGIREAGLPEAEWLLRVLYPSQSLFDAYKKSGFVPVVLKE